VIPIRGQYEQFCNAAALQKMGIPVLDKLDAGFGQVFLQWMEQKKKTTLTLDHSTESIVSYLMHNCSGRKKNSLDLLYPEMVFN
jgi:hypothetical protein